MPIKIQNGNELFLRGIGSAGFAARNNLPELGTIFQTYLNAGNGCRQHRWAQ
jgi:hypothetical protein